MRSVLSVFGVVLVLTLPPVATLKKAVAEEPKAIDRSAAEKLVRAALQEELAGHDGSRTELLSQALNEAPDYQPARWQSQFVRVDQRWLSLEQVRKQALADERLAKYREVRDRCADVPADHVELALWCRKNRLGEEERAHWIRVLHFQPDHPEAIRNLGLRSYEGMLLTHDQIKQLKQQQRQVREGVKRWRSKFAQWASAEQSEDTTASQAVVEEIRAVSSPVDVAAMELAFRKEYLAKNIERDLLARLCLEMVSALGELPKQAATESLVRLAVDAPWEEVRTAAADQLKRRPRHSYIPILLAAMAYPIEFGYSFNLGANFTLFQQTSYYREGEGADVSVLRDATIHAGISLAGSRSAARMRMNVFRKWSEAVRSAERSRINVEQCNALTAQLNQRVRSVLTRAVDLDCGEDPNQWWESWKDYNEVEYPEYKPVYETTYFHYLPLHAYHSCFSGDTPVWTLTGEVPIKQIKFGDRVLSQDPETGELAFKPVLAVTTREPSRMIKIGLGSETITATRGHPFWVNGHGWQMAKQLELGQHLHSASGAVPIEQLVETPPAKPWYEVSYNLVVADFNTYFVGKRQVLVHDNTPHRASFALVPGLPATRLPQAAAVSLADSKQKKE